MIKIFVFLVVICTSFFSWAEGENTEDQVKLEFGTCYNTFDKSLENCLPFVCSYPDMTDAKAWKAHAIKGTVDGSCYVVYYSYVGKEIVGSPDHCFYSTNQTQNLTNAYKRLFSSNSNFDINEARAIINKINNAVCEKNPSKSTNN